MRYGPRALLAGGLGFAASCLVACGGGDGLLSGDQSSTLSSQLDALSSAVGGGHCGSASRALAAFNNSVDKLPSKVNPALRSNLLQGASTVSVLARRDCRANSTSSTTSTTTTATTTTTPSTSTQTSSSTTTTPSSTTTTSPATSSTTPGTTSTSGTGGAGLGGGGGSGGGGGNGNGAGGQ